MEDVVLAKNALPVGLLALVPGNVQRGAKSAAHTQCRIVSKNGEHDKEKSKWRLPAMGCVFHVKVTSRPFDRTNHHVGIIPIALAGATGGFDSSQAEFLRFSCTS